MVIVPLMATDPAGITPLTRNWLPAPRPRGPIVVGTLIDQTSLPAARLYESAILPVLLI